jgi:carbamoylphosphate synthase large subunit
MKRALVCGGSHSDIPQIECLKSFGFRVTTSGNNPEEIGHRYADEFRAADYSCKDSVLKLVKEGRWDLIVPSCNDFSYITCAYIAGIYGRPGYDDYEIAKQIHEKDSFRELCKSLEIIQPRLLDNFTDNPEVEFSYDCDVIIKPVDLSGGKGIQTATTGENIGAKVSHALSRSKAKRVVVEEYVSGTNHGLSVFIKDKRIEYYFIDTEYYYFSKFAVGGTISECNLKEETVQRALAMLERIAVKCQLVDGLLHSQFIVKDEKPYLLEICRRPPGDFYPRFVQMATGNNFSMACVQQYIGQKIIWQNEKKQKSIFIRHCVVPEESGIAVKLKIDSKIKKFIRNIVKLFDTGQYVNSESQQKVAIIFLEIPRETYELSQLENLRKMITTVVVK